MTISSSGIAGAFADAVDRALDLAERRCNAASVRHRQTQVVMAMALKSPRSPPAVRSIKFAIKVPNSDGWRIR
jgi:hypothetical protein